MDSIKETEETKEVKETKKEAPKKGIVSCGGVSLNVRKSPNVTEDNIVGTMADGDEVEIIKESGEFYKVKNDKINGFVMKKFINR